MIKEELLDSLKESEDEDEITLGKIVTSMKDSNKAIRVIKRYQEIRKIKNIKIINLADKPGQLLKKFKESENLFDNSG